MSEAKISVDLDGAVVWLHPEGERPVEAQVVQLWPYMGTVPGANLERLDDGEIHTSVPHISSVPDATSGFWSLGKNPKVESRK